MISPEHRIAERFLAADALLLVRLAALILHIFRRLLGHLQDLLQFSRRFE